MYGEGEVDQFPCNLLRRTLPTVELRTPISFPESLEPEHPVGSLLHQMHLMPLTCFNGAQGACDTIA